MLIATVKWRRTVWLCAAAAICGSPCAKAPDLGLYMHSVNINLEICHKTLHSIVRTGVQIINMPVDLFKKNASFSYIYIYIHMIAYKTEKNGLCMLFIESADDTE